MKPWQFAFAALALLAVAGCRASPSVISGLERDNRLKEDEIYRLRAKVEELEDAANANARRGASATRDDSDRGMGLRGKASSSEPTSLAPPSSYPAPQVSLPSSSSSAVPNTLKFDGGSSPMAVPDVPKHLRGPSAPSSIPNGGRPDSGNGSGKSPEASSMDGPALGGFAGASSVAQNAPRGVSAKPASASSQTMVGGPKGDSRQVASIVIDRMLTGGVNDGSLPVDKGVLVVIEPRDAKGRIIDAPADISVVVVDPAVKGDTARVARWDFTTADTASMFRRTAAGPAIHIEAAWSEGLPTHDKLHVFVRYMTADGRKLEADQPIEIALADEKAPRRLPQRDLRTTESERPIGQAASTAHRPAWSPERR